MNEIKISTRQNKKYMTRTPKGKLVHFGAIGYGHFSDSTPMKYYTYLDHNDTKRRDLYHKRHKAILLKNGNPAYLSEESPAYYSLKYLW